MAVQISVERAMQYSQKRSPKISIFIVKAKVSAVSAVGTNSSDYQNSDVFLCNVPKDITHGSHAIILCSYGSRMIYCLNV